MEPRRLVGPHAGSLKYDLLTALAVVGLNGSPTLQTSLMRLVALITARYNWVTDEICIGQRDMARMWSVNERTVKREMKRLTEAGLLVRKRSGVRGRVGSYRLNYDQIARLSETHWSRVGSDFADRMGERYAQANTKIVQMSAFRQEPAPMAMPQTGEPWGRAMAHLAGNQPNLFGAWFDKLTYRGFDKGVLRLSAPSPFIERYVEMHLLEMLLEAIEREFGPVDQVLFSR